MPDAARDELADALETGGQDLATLMRSRAKRRTGALAAGIKYKVSRRQLRLRAGLLGTPRGRAKLFYGWILNYGRKAQRVKAKRKTASGGLSTYLINVRGFAGDRFVTGAGKELRPIMGKRLRGIWDRILAGAARGTGNE